MFKTEVIQTTKMNLGQQENLRSLKIDLKLLLDQVNLALADQAQM